MLNENESSPAILKSFFVCAVRMRRQLRLFSRKGTGYLTWQVNMNRPRLNLPLIDVKKQRKRDREFVVGYFPANLAAGGLSVLGIATTIKP